ncbi:hypothetical protein SKAU_G00290530 [Synaphobranchus kaupii]|uniref:Uncharacterized protein n=1 Tax=Synaphobranchus kaupii TaxID=118154 RepID=A0A9Q1IK47_SYNKA|nr:hypothetical protein SKAU_G00290530 [Synaphobranchus kaupii]
MPYGWWEQQSASCNARSRKRKERETQTARRLRHEFVRARSDRGRCAVTLIPGLLRIIRGPDLASHCQTLRSRWQQQ